MEVSSRAIETTGTVDAHHHLLLDEALPISGPKKVRVIILFLEEDHIDESEWLQAASVNPSFDFLKNPEEDIYSMNDGKPFNHQK
ncbi:MAG: hypothetical protein PVH61_25425 [Candidatus Aminicenantes bacterium]|jgi:hypothetical protein